MTATFSATPAKQEQAVRTLLLTAADVRRDEAGLRDGTSPRRDYLMLAEHLGADVFDLGSVKRSRLGALLARLPGRGLGQALYAWPRLRRYDVVFSDSEHIGLYVGILLRLLPRRPRHVLLAHHLTPAKKRPFAILARPGIDTLILHSVAQRDLAVDRLGFPVGAVDVLPYQVDAEFWRPPARPARDEALVATAGLECRDYATLLDATDGLPLDLQIGAGSHWSRKRDPFKGRPVPAQVSVAFYDYEALRDLYGRATLVVVPLVQTDFQAGITTILEAMAMARPVIATRTTGLPPVFDGPLWRPGLEQWPAEGPSPQSSAGIYVPPGDAAALRAAIAFLLRNRDVAEMLGANGRRAVEASYTVEQFVQRFADAVRPRS